MGCLEVQGSVRTAPGSSLSLSAGTPTRSLGRARLLCLESTFATLGELQNRRDEVTTTRTRPLHVIAAMVAPGLSQELLEASAADG